jgi:fucose 4-O-acetylase-like acetyltransferase
LATAGQASLIILIFHLPFQSKTFLLASSLFEHHNFFAAALAFVVGSIVPIFLWLLIKRSRILSNLYFPSKVRISDNAGTRAD